MPKQIVCEIYQVVADSPEDAKALAKKESGKRKVVFLAASSVDMLEHPVHSSDVKEMFGVKDGG